MKFINHSSLIINQKAFIKLTKSALISYLIIFFAFSSITGLFLFNPFGTKETEAAWFNDNWAFRKRVDLTISSNSADATNVDLYFTVDTTGITASLQTNCEDLRFTNTGGKLLNHFFQSSCSDNSATNKIWVRADLVPKNTTTFTVYMYYGNPTALSGNGSSDLNTGLFRVYNGMTGYWPMNESSWTIDCSTRSITDLSGSAFNLASCPTTTGPTLTTSGKFDKAGSFDGTSDEYLGCTDAQCGGTSNLDIQADQDWSVTAWVKTSAAALQAVAGKEDFRDGGNPDGWGFNLSSTGRIQGYFRDNESTTQVVSTDDGTAVNDNAWHFITVVFNRTGNIVRYVDGSQTGTQDSISAANNAILDNSDDFRIGERGVGGLPFTGTIDDVRFYNRALSTAQITEIYNKNSTIGTSTSFASEEKAPSPTLYWKFDDPAVSSVIQDGTTNGLDGTLNNTPTFQTEDQCVSGKCYYFSGTANMNVSRADDAKLDFVAADNFTIQAWVKRNGASSAVNYIITKAQAGYTGYKLYQDTSGDYCFDVSDGTNTDTACTSAVDFDDDQWHFVTGVKAGTTSITLYVDGKQRAQDASIAATGTLANTGTFYAGVDLDGTSNEWLGFIDEVKVFRDQSARTAAQVLADFNARSNPEGVSSQQGNNITNMPAALSNGLVGYWKLDEGSGDASDSSGNSLTLTNNSTTPYAYGKFGNAGSFTAASTDYFSTATTISGVKTVAFWTNPSANSDEYINLIASTAYITSSSGTVSATGFTSPTIYVNGVVNGTVTASVWNHVVVTTETGINASAFEVGRGNGAYHNGKIDDVRTYSRALSGAEVSQLYNWAPGPVGYWKMDERTGTTNTYDSSGGANNGTMTSMEATDWVQGKYGSALDFDGSGEYVTLANESNFDFENNTQFSVEAWIKMDALSSYGIISKQAASVNFEGWVLFTEDPGTGQEVGFQLRTGASDQLVVYSSGAALAVNNWYHIAATYDGSTDVSGVKIYVNGVSLATANTTDTLETENSILNNVSPQISGREGANFLFDGKIDEAKVYNYIRTPAQVIEDMNAGHPAPGSPVGSPLIHWKFNEGYSTTANNSGNIGSTINGTLNNMASPATSTSGWTNTAKFGRGLIFDGADDVVTSTSTDASMANLAAMTTSAWIYPNSEGESSIGVIAGKASGTGPTSGWLFQTIATKALSFTVDYDTTNLSVVSSNNSLTLSGWNFVTLTWDGTSTATNVHMYVNGREVSYQTQTNAAGSRVTDAAQNLRVGNDSGGIATFDGTIDEFKLYTSVLNTSQIKLDMNQASTQVLGALGTNSSFQSQAASQEYCIPGDATTCTAPVFRWDMEEGTGTTTNDTSGNGFTGTLTLGPTWGRGKQGKGVVFDATDDYITTATNVFNPSTTDFTISGWFRSNALGVQQNIVSEQDGGGTGRSLLYIDATSVLITNIGGTTTLGATTLVAGTWYFGTVTKSGTTVKLYLNGREDATATRTAESAAGVFIIGANKVLANVMNGTLDQIRMYTYARTPAQIAWDYNRGLPVAHWKMDECQGTTINDSAGNSLTGTLTIGGSGGNTTPGTCSTSGAWFDGVSGKRNYSMDFDDTDDYISTSANSALNITVDITLSAWIKRGGTSNYGGIIAKTDGAGTAFNYDLGICSTSAGCTGGGANVDKFFFYSNATTPAQVFSTSAITDTTNWYHIVLTRSGSTYNFYINGRLDSTGSMSGAFANNSYGVYIGTDEIFSTSYFNGGIDDARIYNYALTATQVKSLYNEGAARYGPVTGAP